jgi:hypothetical protein
MTGEVSILSVGHGDTKLSFDKSNPAEAIRAARIVKDMLRRGYALLIEIPGTGSPTAWQRVYEFREDTCEYVIADFDPEAAAVADAKEADREQIGETEGAGAPAPAEAPARAEPPRRRGRPPKMRNVPAASTRAVAIGRSAGG